MKLTIELELSEAFERYYPTPEEALKDVIKQEPDVNYKIIKTEN